MAEIELPRLVQKLFLDASGVKKGAAEAEAAFNKATLAVGQTGAAAAGLGQSYNKASAAADEASKKTLAAWNKASDGMADVGKKLSTFVTLPLLGIGAAGLKVAGEFDTTMRTMAAVAGVPAPELKQLSSLALQMGKDTVFSANDAAGAMLNLAKAGISTADIMGGGLKATLDLAAAGGLDLGNAATIAANAMHTFGLSGKDAASIADALAGAANASSADVSDLALALSQGGLAAHAAHLSLQETTATLAAFADAGIRGCYDIETEVLTKQGFVPWTDVALDTEFATVNPATDAIEFQFPTRLVRYRHEGKMYRVRNRNVDLLVTPDHRMWVQPVSRVREMPWQAMSAEEVQGRNIHYRTGGLKWDGESPEYFVLPGFSQSRGRWTKEVLDRSIPTDAWAAFMGYYLSEGSHDVRRGCYRVSIAQKNGSKKDRMLVDLQRLGFKVHVGKRALVILSEQLYRAVQDQGHCHEKYVPDYVKGWAPDLLRTFWMAFCLGDGLQDGSCCWTSSPHLRDGLSEVVLKAGWGTYVSQDSQVGESTTMRDGRVVTATRTSWKVSAKRRNLTPAFMPAEYQIGTRHGDRAPAGNHRGLEEWVPYDDEVFCATVPNSLLIVRRNGKTVVSGNSDAGTSLKTFLLNLVPNTKPARAAMADLGLKFTDLRGAMLPIGDIAEQLKVKTANLSDEQKILALQTIFGTDAYRAALVISEQGAAGLDKYRAATSKVGTAAEVAAARMAGWKGTWEQFRGSVETAALSIGNIVIPAITPLVNKVKELADSFTDLDPKQAAFLVTLGGVAAAAGPALLVVGKLGTSVGALSETLGAAPLAITGWGLAILAIGVALAGAWDKSELLRNAVGKLMNAGEDLSSVVRNLVTDFAPLGAALASIATATVIAGLSAIAAILSTLTGFLADHPALVGTLAAAYLVTLVPAIYAAVTAFAALKLEQVAVGFYNLVEAVEKGIVALGGLAAAATTALALTGLGLALYKLSTTMGDTVDAGKKLVSVLKEQTTLDSAHAWEAYGKALAGAKGELGKIHLSSKAVNEELAKTKNVASNIATVQATAHLSAEAIYDLAQKLKIDLTQGGDKAKEGTAKLVAEFESLTKEAYGSSDATRFVSTDFKKLEEDAKATAEAVKKVSEAFQKDVDAISGYSKFLQDATKNSDAYSSAQERLKGAQDALAALRERQAGDDKITISDQQQLAKATDDVAKAQQGVADAAAQVKGTSLATFYEEQLSKAQAFADGVQDAAARGLDPNLIMRLLQAGPDAAAPFLQGLAQDHSTRIIEIVNKAEEALALINSKVIANSRIVQQALNDDKSDQKVRDIGLAMEVSAASFDAAGNITRQAIADKIKKPLDDVNRVVDEFGIKVTNMPDINVQSNAKSVTDDLKDAQRAAQELDGTTATVTVFHNQDTVYHDDLSHASAMGNVLGQFGIVPMARGGTRTPGFVTHGPSFLVGEGKASRPEYVVPTDPAFHDRAVKLWGGLTSELFPHSGIGNDGAMSPSWGSLGAGISQAPQSPVTMGPARAMAQPESIDYERLGAETAKALRGNVNFRLDINGRAFAEATADDMSKAQGDNRKGRTRS